MKRILIADDNHSKRKTLAASAERLFPGAEIEVYECQHDIMQAVRYNHFSEIEREPEKHLLVLDMQMPLFDGDIIEADGGLSVLAWLRQLDVKCPAIIVSSEKIDEALASKYYEHYKGFVHYEAWSTPTSAMRKVLAEYLSPDENSSPDKN